MLIKCTEVYIPDYQTVKFAIVNTKKLTMFYLIMRYITTSIWISPVICGIVYLSLSYIIKNFINSQFQTIFTQLIPNILSSLFLVCICIFFNYITHQISTVKTSLFAISYIEWKESCNVLSSNNKLTLNNVQNNIKFVKILHELLIVSDGKIYNLYSEYINYINYIERKTYVLYNMFEMFKIYILFSLVIFIISSLLQNIYLNTLILLIFLLKYNAIKQIKINEGIMEHLTQVV